MVYLAVDTGTTNTTVWLLQDDRVIAQLREPVGARLSAFGDDSRKLAEVLRECFHQLSRKTGQCPSFVLAAGMITSSLGLLEVPHVLAPADSKTLSLHVRRKTLPQITNVPFFFVPGVRIHPFPARLGSVEMADVIRGEETEIMGLLSEKPDPAPWVLLHLGSHTKAIEIDRGGRIVRGVSTLGGECLELLRTRTVLARRLGQLGEVPALRPRLVRRGAECAAEHGLLRAAFMVRLLEENPTYAAQDLYSFLIGAVIGTDYKALATLFKAKKSRVLLSGHSLLMQAWREILRQLDRNLPVIILPPEGRTDAFLKGLREIVFVSPVYQQFAKSAQRNSARRDAHY